MAYKESRNETLPAPIGLVRLIQELGLSVNLPAVRSEVVAGARRTRVSDGIVFEYYPRIYAPENLIGQLKFAMRHEPIDLGVLHAVFQVLEPSLLESWVRAERTGGFARRAWYLYELLTGKQLDIPNVPPTGYVDLLDPEIHIVGPTVRIRRQRLNNNLLGTPNYCPLIRRTELLQNSMNGGLDKEARSLAESCDPNVLARAVSYLFTKETKSSYAIEGEAPNVSRAERFVAALSHAADFDVSNPQSFVLLQNAIVDPRYAETSWRKIQNFVAQTKSDFTEHVHFVPPKPEDVSTLMQAWMQMLDRWRPASVDAICAAAAASFGFVFIHPFEDGNGRIHRFLIHHILASAGFTPPGLLFPVSAVMLRDRRAYDQVLNSYSSAIMPFIKYTMEQDGRMMVENATDHLYRFWDATPFAEYLYSCVAQAIHHDLREEIGFLRVFDAAVQRTMEIVDMPDRRASLLVRLILQNKGNLAKGRRQTFSELTDDEIAAIESAVRSSAPVEGFSPEE